MAKAITVPKLGLTMEKATITTWMKEEGDLVRKGEVVCLIETDKVNFEVEAPESGVLAKVIAGEGAVLPVGALLAVVAKEGETFDLDALIHEASEVKVAEERKFPETPIPTGAGVQREEKRELKASPLARRIAEEKGVSLEEITGTGPGGSITKEDVLQAAQTKDVTPLQILRKIPLSGVRKVIAERMTESWHTAARVTQVMEVDMTEIIRFRQEKQKDWEAKGVHVTLNDVLIKIVSQALLEIPEINCSVKGQEVEVYKNVNMGIAVATQRGLIVPVLKNASGKSLLEIAKESRVLIEKTQEGKIGLDDLKFGTFTITNLGTFGIEFFTPIINQPESAILGVGKIDQKVKVLEGDKIAIRSMMYLSFVFDHRVIDGAPAARFLGRVKEMLEHPEQVKEVTR